jgi:hypothetical protein
VSKCFYRVSAKALIKDDQSRLLLIKEGNDSGLELPGGGVELGLEATVATSLPVLIWFINGEVVWLIYEVHIPKGAKVMIKEPEIAGFFDIEELLANEELGYCCSTHFDDLQKYLAK